MKYLILALALAGCSTTAKPQVQTDCLDVGSQQGTITLCPMPAGTVCFFQDGKLVNCLQLQDPILRASK
jgi:hypothetical protein